MSFQERSAWVMAFILSVFGLLYFNQVWSMTTSLGKVPPPNLPTIIVYTVLLVGVTTVAHIVSAILSPSEAELPSDEREKQIFDRAGHWASYILGGAVVMSLGSYLVLYDGNVLFYCILCGFFLAQLTEYLLQIYFYRVGL